MRRFLLAVVITLGMASPAWARTEKTLAYPRPEAWAAAVRFIRVDAHLKVTEKDEEAGYVLFELHEENKTFRGSLELMTVVDEGRPAVRFVLQLEDRPSYEEAELMTKLVVKLRAEIGEPTPAPSKPDKPPAGDDKTKPDDKPRGDKPDDKRADKPPEKPNGGDKPRDDGPPISDTP